MLAFCGSAVSLSGLQLLDLASATPDTHLPSYLPRIFSVLGERLGGDGERIRESSNPSPETGSTPSARWVERLSLCLLSCFWAAAPGETQVLRGLGLSLCVLGHSDEGSPGEWERQGLGPVPIYGTPGKSICLSELVFCL